MQVNDYVLHSLSGGREDELSRVNADLIGLPINGYFYRVLGIFLDQLRTTIEGIAASESERYIIGEVVEGEGKAACIAPVLPVLIEGVGGVGLHLSPVEGGSVHAHPGVEYTVSPFGRSRSVKDGFSQIRWVIATIDIEYLIRALAVVVDVA